eukprot:243722-Chlamydomonas_euryale.AAC.1
MPFQGQGSGVPRAVVLGSLRRFAICGRSVAGVAARRGNQVWRPRKPKQPSTYACVVWSGRLLSPSLRLLFPHRAPTFPPPPVPPPRSIHLPSASYSPTALLLPSLRL